MEDSSSPCIARTYSQPISYANQEEHCYRALTPSYSFGRYESDLEWGKWSCFSQNRCLEEVQKLSKPGTVAAMKAYFEARYKRVANKKSSVVPSYQQNQQNEVPRDFDDTSVMKFHKKSQMVSDSAKFSKTVFCYVTEKNDLVAGCSYDMGNALEEGEVTASITRKSASAPSKASIFGGTSKLRAPIAPRKKNNSTPNSDKAARDATVKRPPPLDSLHKPLSYDSCASEAKKTSSPILDSIRNLRIIKSFGKSSKDSRTKHALTRERVHGEATCNSETPHQENISCVQSSTAGRTNPSSTVLSSLSFQCDERGARHKEKLENKLNMKGKEKAQLQTKSKSHSPEVGRKPAPRQGQESDSARPRLESLAKKQLKVCYRKE
ncbi:hypothetical protein DCAR_0207935 [Daucus carota subsp. sativus]|uniref:TPX2 C-terminal domain-containing protein n=1 Tax=Daucus carota subsp. sativus TaxID=79200 RepID=A0AAF0WEZ5_DAUCS|nr:hypothetical protein DCAR_0207935 [Daucus carota subsp. sativus]